MMTWRERIVAARARGGFTDTDRADAQLAWETCAVGEQHNYFPDVVVYRKGAGHRRAGLPILLEPVDSTLFRLGTSRSGGFGFAVGHDHIDLAESLLDQIEDRVLELKREQMSEKQGSFSDNIRPSI